MKSKQALSMWKTGARSAMSEPPRTPIVQVIVFLVTVANHTVKENVRYNKKGCSSISTANVNASDKRSAKDRRTVTIET